MAKVSLGPHVSFDEALTAIEKHTLGTCHYAKDDEGQL